MKRAALALPLLAFAMPAQAQSAGPLCNGLAQIVVAAEDNFAPLPNGHYIPGAHRESRSMTGGTPPRAEYMALMAQGSHAAVAGRFDPLVHEVQRCLPGRSPSVEGSGLNRAATWRLDRAVIRVVLTGSNVESQQADLQLVVLDRW